MIRFAALAALVAAPLALWSFASPTSTPSAGVCNLWTHEPLVVFDVTGATLSGPLDESLQVFSDGTVKRFSVSQGISTIAFANPQDAVQLLRDLFAAGGFTACDQPAAGSDVPLRSLTLFRGVETPLAHTVNWWTEDLGPYGTFQDILDDFVASHVP
ncbi:MAG TPA: hypothetical protein VMT18_08520 [Planctomycetota bacterium]|nr:hypothetical protein [Planctomycetota bacterium]